MFKTHSMPYRLAYFPNHWVSHAQLAKREKKTLKEGVRNLVVQGEEDTVEYESKQVWVLFSQAKAFGKAVEQLDFIFLVETNDIFLNEV